MIISTFILVVLYVVYFGVLITLGYVSYKMPKFKIGKSEENSEETSEIKVTSQNYIYTGILLAVIGILVNTYIVVQGTIL